MKKILLLSLVLIVACLFVASCSCEAEYKLTVSFESHTEEKIPTVSVEYGAKIDEPQLESRAGYRLLGWYDGQKKWDFAADTVTKDTTLTAKWESYLSYVEATDGSGELWVTGCLFDVESVVIPSKYNGRAVSGIHWGFADRTKIKTVFVPETVTYISENSFKGCISLTEIQCAANEKPSGWHEDFDVVREDNKEKHRVAVRYGIK